MKKVLFVCVENSCRSQMAEGFARHFAKGDVEAYSAGSKPSGIVNPRAIQFMAEKNIDLNQQASEGIEKFEHLEFDHVITMGCGDTCSHVKAKERHDWALEDPKHLDDDGFRKVRDEIEKRVSALLKNRA